MWKHYPSFKRNSVNYIVIWNFSLKIPTFTGLFFSQMNMFFFSVGFVRHCEPVDRGTCPLGNSTEPPPVWYFWRWFGYVASFECRISSLSWENLQEFFFFFVRCRFFKEDYLGAEGWCCLFSTILGGSFKYVLFSFLFGEMNGNDTMWLKPSTGWWQLNYFLFSSLLKIPNLKNIFQMLWNHMKPPTSIY